MPVFFLLFFCKSHPVLAFGLCIKKQKYILYSSISPLGSVLKHTQDQVFRGQRIKEKKEHKLVFLSYVLLREP